MQVMCFTYECGVRKKMNSCLGKRGFSRFLKGIGYGVFVCKFLEINGS